MAAKSLVEVVIDATTDCEIVHQQAMRHFPTGVYWRFNVGVKGSDDWGHVVGMDDHQSMGKLEGITYRYVEKMRDDIGQCGSGVSKLWATQGGGVA